MKKYLLKQQIKAVYFKLYNDYLFTLESDNSFFKVYNLNNHELIKTSSQNNYGGGIYLFNNVIIDETLSGIRIDNFEETKIFSNFKYYYSIHDSRYLIVREFIEEFKPVFYLLDVISLNKVNQLNITGGPIIINNDLVITRKEGLYAYSIENNSLVWQQDLKETLKYHFDKKDVYGQIKQIKHYKDSVIVVSDGGVIRLLLETGEILWKSKTYARTMEIVEETGYVCTNHSLYKVNLKSGTISGYGWEYHRLPDLEYNGKTYWAVGHEVIYHNGLLWYSVYSAGESFITAINPESGNYEWIHHVDTYEKIESPRFYDNKMFILDTGGTLHIYEKDS